MMRIIKRSLFIALTLLGLASCASMESGKYIRLKAGDNWKKLAKEFKTPSWVIKEANKGKKLRPGNWVFIPLRRGIMSSPTKTYYRLSHPDAPGGKGRFIWPVPSSKRVSSNFGHRWGRQHEGIDIAAREGSHFLAAESGVVVYADNELGGYGNLIVLAHKGGFFTVYAHAERVYVDKGDDVVKGQTIGRVGQTGRATGPHLHFEVRRNSRALNPTAYLDKK